VASVLSFFLSLILHELGHALVARRNGLQVAGIELWALGGITRTNGAFTSPGPEFRVAVAGPLVTLGVVVVSGLAGAGLASHFFEVAAVKEGLHSTPAVVWLSWVFALNLLVLVVNLVPAFPLDGGQIAHALIWRVTGDRNRATRATGRAGQGFALLMGAGGLALIGMYGSLTGVFLMAIALFVYQGATMAVAQGGMGQRIQGLTVADVMDTEPVTIPADLRLIDAQEEFFGRYRWPWFAVVDPARHFLGVIRSERLDAEIAAGRPALQVVDVLEDNLQVRIDEDQPLESLLRSEGLGRLGAMVAVDGEGVLRGVVTVAQIRQALRPAAGI
jgi:Zn-dependent protease